MSDDFTAGLRRAVMKALTKHGEAFNPDINTFGDSRGEHDYNAERHIKQCAPKTMTGYTEEYNWSISDTANYDAHVGVRAFITCECGQVENVAFIIPDVGLGTILGWLLEEG